MICPFDYQGLSRAHWTAGGDIVFGHWPGGCRSCQRRGAALATSCRPARVPPLAPPPPGGAGPALHGAESVERQRRCADAGDRGATDDHPRRQLCPLPAHRPPGLRFGGPAPRGRLRPPHAHNTWGVARGARGLRVWPGGLRRLCRLRHVVHRRLVALPASSMLTRLVWRDRSGRTSELPFEPRDYLFPSLSADGRRLTVTVSRWPFTYVWIGSVDGEPLQQLTRRGRDMCSIFSKDGQWIAFTSARDGWSNLFKVRADGTDVTAEPERLTEASSNHKPTSWSRNGRWVLFNDNQGPPWKRDIARVAVVSSKVREPGQNGEQRNRGGSVAGRALDRLPVGRVGPVGGLRSALPRPGRGHAGVGERGQGTGWKSSATSSSIKPAQP